MLFNYAVTSLLTKKWDLPFQSCSSGRSFILELSKFLQKVLLALAYSSCTFHTWFTTIRCNIWKTWSCHALEERNNLICVFINRRLKRLILWSEAFNLLLKWYNSIFKLLYTIFMSFTMLTFKWQFMRLLFLRWI